MSEQDRKMENIRAEGRAGADNNQNQSHDYSPMVIHRLSRAIGHLESVKKMAEEGRDCTDILIQLAAVRGAISSISRAILKDHMERCVMDAMQSGNHDALDNLNRAIDQMMR